MPDTPVVVAGLTRLSTVDWPGHLAATVFLQGCPWRCTYCHNPDLIDPRTPGSMTWAQVLEFLSRRVGLLDGVVFSGGEPTMQPVLPRAIADVRELGFAVGLHTGGAWPRRLALVLPQLDWVGLDIKALPDSYDAVTGAGPSGRAAFASLDLLVASGVDHEVRTTVDPTVHTRAQVLALADLVASAGARRHVLQEARDVGTDPAWAARLADRTLADVLEPDDLASLVRR